MRKAVDCYRKAYAKKSEFAANALGDIAFDERRYAEAIKYFEFVLSESSHSKVLKVNAAHKLGEIYQRGCGVAADSGKAQMYYNLEKDCQGS